MKKPRLRRRKLSDLRIAGVYVLYRSGVPVYVGQSQDVEQRIREHAWVNAAARHTYRGEFDEYAYVAVELAPSRTALEQYLIAHYRPEGNILHLRKARREFQAILSDPFFAPTVHQRITEKKIQTDDK